MQLPLLVSFKFRPISLIKPHVQVYDTQTGWTNERMNERRKNIR